MLCLMLALSTAPGGQFPVNGAAGGDDGPGLLVRSGVVSMGRRNTGPKSNLQMFQRPNSFGSADSKKTLPCLGLIEYSPRDQVALKNIIASTD